MRNHPTSPPRTAVTSSGHCSRRCAPSISGATVGSVRRQTGSTRAGCHRRMGGAGTIFTEAASKGMPLAPTDTERLLVGQRDRAQLVNGAVAEASQVPRGRPQRHRLAARRRRRPRDLLRHGLCDRLRRRVPTMAPGGPTPSRSRTRLSSTPSSSGIPDTAARIRRSAWQTATRCAANSRSSPSGTERSYGPSRRATRTTRSPRCSLNGPERPSSGVGRGYGKTNLGSRVWGGCGDRHCRPDRAVVVERPCAGHENGAGTSWSGGGGAGPVP